MADAPFYEEYTGNLAVEAQRAFAGVGVPYEEYTGNLAAEAQRAFVSAPFLELPQPPPPPAPPVVGNFSPVVASTVYTDTPISFDVTDTSGLFRRIVVLVQFPNLKIYDAAHDGSAFGNRYLLFANSKVAIANGFRFTFLREGGWPASPRIVPIAIDEDGNEAPVESQTYAWTLIEQ